MLEEFMVSPGFHAETSNSVLIRRSSKDGLLFAVGGVVDTYDTLYAEGPMVSGDSWEKIVETFHIGYKPTYSDPGAPSSAP